MAGRHCIVEGAQSSGSSNSNSSIRGGMGSSSSVREGSTHLEVEDDARDVGGAQALAAVGGHLLAAHLVGGRGAGGGAGEGGVVSTGEESLRSPQVRKQTHMAV